VETFATLFREAFGGFPIISGRFIRHAFADRFQECVRTILYGQPAPTSELLRAITRLCATSHDQGRIDAIVSYNYDDLVERHMEARGVRFRSIYSEGQSPRTDELPIYHVHGYLPADGKEPHSGEIVFAEDAYHTQFLDPYGWANITQLNLLRERTGLFLGHSMTDPNLRRLLDVAHRHTPDRRHYVVLRSPTPDEMECRTNGKKEQERMEAFTRAFQSIQEDALTDLGQSVLWVDSYEQVPLLLNQIRKAQRQ
ncbi:MAG TPA: SIR2 family protein, partial [Armatimonadota bacterium]|nr:SIR2 family protein [Armatimonadota bacterium]